MKRKNYSFGNLASASSFFLFLHCSGCLETFMANMVRFSQSSDASRCLVILFSLDPSKYVSCAFLWRHTPEGFSFWMQVNDAWAEYRSAYHIS